MANGALKINVSLDTSDFEKGINNSKVQAEDLKHTLDELTLDDGTKIQVVDTSDIEKATEEIAKLNNEIDLLENDSVLIDANYKDIEIAEKETIQTNTAMKNLSKNAKTAANNTSQIGQNAKKSKKEVNGVVKAFNGLKTLMLNLYIFQGVFNFLGDSITSFFESANQSDKFSQSINNLKGSFEQFKTSIGNLIVTVGAPFVNLLNFLIEKITYFASVLTVLWGGSLVKTKKEQDKLTGSVKDTAKAQKQLAGFDEMNILSSNTSSGGGTTSTTPEVDLKEKDVNKTVEKIKVTFGKFKSWLNKTLTPALVNIWSGLKGGFDEVWAGAIKPALNLVLKIYTDFLNILIDKWNTYGVPIMQNLKEYFKGVAETWRMVWETILKPVWNYFIIVIDEVWNTHLKPLLDNFMSFIAEFIKGTLELYNNVIIPIVQWLVKYLGPAVTVFIKGLIDGISTGVRLISDILNGVINIFRGLIDFILGVFTGDWGRAWDGVVKIFKGSFEGIIGVVKFVLNTLIDGINTFTGLLGLIKIDVPDWIPGIGGKKFGINIPKIPKLAQGAVIPPNQEFLAVLGDQKRGTNIEAPLSTIQEAVRGVVGNQEITINFAGDIASLVRVLKPYIDSENSRKGTAMVM